MLSYSQYCAFGSNSRHRSLVACDGSMTHNRRFAPPSGIEIVKSSRAFTSVVGNENPHTITYLVSPSCLCAFCHGVSHGSRVTCLSQKGRKIGNRVPSPE